MDFVDLRGRYYAIPDQVLVEHEVRGDLPDLPLTGLEASPIVPGADEGGYSWVIQEGTHAKSRQYVWPRGGPR